MNYFHFAILSMSFLFCEFQPRRISYSRHDIKDEEVAAAGNNDVNYKVHMHVRRMMSENKMAKRKKKQNGSAVGKDMKVQTEGEIEKKKEGKKEI